LARGKPELDSEKCKGCALCIDACPVNILKMSDDFNKQGVSYATCINEDACIACKFCAMMCPDMVIKVVQYV